MHEQRPPTFQKINKPLTSTVNHLKEVTELEKKDGFMVFIRHQDEWLLGYYYCLAKVTHTLVLTATRYILMVF